jgi:hypothetical protein
MEHKFNDGCMWESGGFSMCRFFKVHYRLKSGSCKWRCISLKGGKYHLAIPITKWVFKFEPFTNWVYVGRNVF